MVAGYDAALLTLDAKEPTLSFYKDLQFMWTSDLFADGATPAYKRAAQRSLMSLFCVLCCSCFALKSCAGTSNSGCISSNKVFWS